MKQIKVEGENLEALNVILADATALQSQHNAAVVHGHEIMGKVVAVHATFWAKIAEMYPDTRLGRWVFDDAATAETGYAVLRPEQSSEASPC